MPNMANITVKNVANADVIYVAATPSAGDRSPAVWRQNALSSVMGHRPVFTALSRDNAAGTARNVSFTFKYPVTVIDGGVTKVLHTIPIRCEAVLPTDISVDLNSEAFTQFGNLMVSSLIRSSISEGYAPT